MAITPNSVVHFLNVPLENNYKNQIYFNSRSEQSSYMASHYAKDPNGHLLSFDNLTYVRKDNIIRVPKHIDDLINVNYVMYQNTNYTNRWFYAFVTKMEYINDGRTDVYIETDCWQTWFDKINLKQSFVEREHVMDDRIGLNIIDENINSGDYICQFEENIEELWEADKKYWVIVSSSYDPIKKTKYAGIGTYGGYPQSTPWFCFLKTKEAGSLNSLANWLNLISDGHAEDIVSIFTAPYNLINEADIDSETYRLKGGSGADLNTVKSYGKYQFQQFNDYEAKNNKLFTYPYSFCRITNNVGNFNDYKIEDFNYSTYNEDDIINPYMSFNISVIACEGCSGRITPLNYKGVNYNEEESVPLGKYPSLSWTTDSFTNWMAQNNFNITKDVIFNGISAVANTAIGNYGGTVSGLSNMVNIIGQLEKAKFLPNNVGGNANNGDIMLRDNALIFKIMHLRPKVEFLKVIDDFFEMYGYKINQVKIPNINGRPLWNYIKTVDVNLDGDIPNEDLTKVRNMFDNGITFWKKEATVEDYSGNNHVGVIKE